jgi:hypothetical protein
MVDRTSWQRDLMAEVTHLMANRQQAEEETRESPRDVFPLSKFSFYTYQNSVTNWAPSIQTHEPKGTISRSNHNRFIFASQFQRFQSDAG